MKTAALVLLLVTLAFTSEEDETLKRQGKGFGNCLSHLRLGDFDNWKSKSGKKYERCGSEHNKRFQNFLNNLSNIQKLKELFPSADFDTNEFSDLSPEEFKAMRTGLKVTPPEELDLKRGVEEVTEVAQTTNVQQWDWSSYSSFGLGLTTGIKNQGSCGSCWAHASTSAAEHSIKINTGVNRELSQQQLIDCYLNPNSNPSSPYGCNGGPVALNKIKSDGLVPNTSYMPTSNTTRTAGTCSIPGDTRSYVTDYAVLTTTTEEALAASLVANGPHVIGMYASGAAIQNYRSGVVSASACGFNGNNYDHAVVVVGFNKCANPPYWIVQNSWGSNWGEKGFFRLEYGTNACGMAQVNFRAQYPKVNKVAWNGPTYPSGQCSGSTPTPTPTPKPTSTPTPTPTPKPTPTPTPSSSTNCKTIPYYGSKPCVPVPSGVSVPNTDTSKPCFNYQNSGNYLCFVDTTNYTAYPCTCSTTVNAVQGNQQPITLSPDQQSSNDYAFTSGQFAGIVIGTVFITLLVAIVAIVTYKYATRYYESY